MSNENNKDFKNGNIGLIAGGILLLFALVVYVWSSKTDQATNNTTGGGDSINQEEKRPVTNEDAGKLGPNEVEITAENFEKEVVGYKGVVVVDAFAPWCPHCQRIAPIITELSNEYAGKVKFGKMNADNQDTTKKANFDFAIANGLTGYPTTWIYKDGQKVSTVSGERTKAEYKTEIEKYLK